ncbi:MAG: hypothetical protein IJU29_03725 [Oscillospiraceae bacterium]|nr:hypothetical protein [Oscillospiraceae bacterium]
MKIGLLGERLPHSFSPEIHRRLGYPGGGDYRLMEVSPEKLGEFFRLRDFDGINVTIPYKRAVIPYLADMSREARETGAVNTVVNRGGALYGHNTDLGGLMALLRSIGAGDLTGKTVLIAGAGGTSLTARAAARRLGAERIFRLSRTPSGEGDVLGYGEAYARYGGAQVLINTTPAGMYPRVESCPVDLDRLPRLDTVADVIYNPVTTELVCQARERGIPHTGNGLGMLVCQAALAAAWFTGAPDSPPAWEPLRDALAFEKTNLVLAGMPGSGKSTLGRLLAKKLGRPFFDCDAEIVRSAGMPIPEIFSRYGETRFRDMETETLARLCREPGQVIATGGGGILRTENRRSIQRGGKLIFLDRPLSELLPTADRPLSDDREKLEALYRTRYPVYLAAAEDWNGLRVPVAGTPEETANEIISMIENG